MCVKHFIITLWYHKKLTTGNLVDHNGFKRDWEGCDQDRDIEWRDRDVKTETIQDYMSADTGLGFECFSVVSYNGQNLASCDLIMHKIQ